MNAHGVPDDLGGLMADLTEETVQQTYTVGRIAGRFYEGAFSEVEQYDLALDLTRLFLHEFLLFGEEPR